jgi:hypothetical protein
MRVIENPKLREKERSSGPLGEVKSALNLGRSSGESEAQDEVIAVLQRTLDNNYVLLRDVVLEGLEVTIPLVLVGPTGIHVLNPSPSRGIYRAKEQNWEKMDDRQQQLRSATPNLVRRTLLMSRAVESFLQSQFQEIPEVEPVLVFTHPGTHVDSVRPAVRIVMADAQDRYVASVVQSDILLDQSDVESLAELLSPQPDLGAESEIQKDIVDSFSLKEQEERKKRQGPMPGEQYVEMLNERMPFTTRQWLVLGAMVLVNVILLIAFVVIVLSTS